jgi:CRISPR-associated endoribonuclease Cas6
MGYLAPFPDQLKEIEYVRVYFHLECCESFELPRLALLQLRRELLQALKTLQNHCDGVVCEGLKDLLVPSLPSDPALVRLVQKPAPALVLSPDVSCFGRFELNQRLIFPVILVGPAIQQLNALWRLIQCLGEQGIYNGNGKFIVEAVESENAEGQRAMLWMNNEPFSELIAPINSLFWWLDRQPFPDAQITLSVNSPLRLLQRGKPLFKISFAEMFPFILRRVSSLLSCYGQFDMSGDAGYLIDLANHVEMSKNCLVWNDWRRLKNIAGGQNLGGLLGEMVLQGESLSELIWILQLGSLFNVGKGAAYGAGQYTLSYA